MKRLFYTILVTALLGFCSTTHADIMLNALGVQEEVNFDNFAGDGFASSPSATQVDSDTFRATGFSEGDGVFGGTHDTGNFARGLSTGGVTESGTYAFDLGGGDRGIGVQPTDSEFNPGTFTIRVMNATGGAVESVNVSGESYYFNDQDRSTRWFFEISLDDANYLTFDFRDSGEAADAAPTWTFDPIFGQINFPTPLADGQRFYLRIRAVDLGGTGQRDEFALSRIAFTAVPEPNSIAALSFLVAAVVVRRKRA